MVYEEKGDITNKFIFGLGTRLKKPIWKKSPATSCTWINITSAFCERSIIPPEIKIIENLESLIIQIPEKTYVSQIQFIPKTTLRSFPNNSFTVSDSNGISGVAASHVSYLTRGLSPIFFFEYLTVIGSISE